MVAVAVVMAAGLSFSDNQERINDHPTTETPIGEPLEVAVTDWNTGQTLPDSPLTVKVVIVKVETPFGYIVLWKYSGGAWDPDPKVQGYVWIEGEPNVTEKIFILWVKDPASGMWKQFGIIGNSGGGVANFGEGYVDPAMPFGVTIDGPPAHYCTGRHNDTVSFNETMKSIENAVKARDSP